MSQPTGNPTTISGYYKRILVFNAALVAASCAIVHYLDTHRSRNEVWRSQVMEFARQGADLLISEVEPGTGMTFQLWSLALMKNPDVLMVANLDPQGRPTAVVPNTAGFDALAAEVDLAAPSGRIFPWKEAEGMPDVFVAAHPLRERTGEESPPNEFGGSAVVVAKPTPTSKPSAAWVGDLGSALAVIATAILVGMCGNWLLRGSTHQDLQKLVRDHDVSEQSWRESLPVGRSDEIGQIARKFEELYDELLQKRVQHSSLKRTLDARVADRVRQISALLKKAEQQAWMDPMTKLGNRRLLDDRLEQLFANQQAAGDDLTIVMFDVDHFKALNDTHGHVAGDQLLSFLGDLLRSSLRATDIGIRYGGDEFVLLLLGVNSEDGYALAERVCKLFAQQAKLLPMEPRPSLSAGVASMSADLAVSGVDLLAKADQALYRAKRAGRNLVLTAR